MAPVIVTTTAPVLVTPALVFVATALVPVTTRPRVIRTATATATLSAMNTRALRSAEWA